MSELNSASSSPSGDPPRSVAEAEITRVVNIGRARLPSGESTLAPVRPSVLLSERFQRPSAAGRFIITGEIARGGMGVIYRGHDPDLGRDLAIKVLKPEWGEQPDIVTMFLNEARICGRLQHPGIVPIHEVGMMGDGSPFIAMKLVEGQTFARLLVERGQSAHDLQRILRIFEVVCQTLAYAHARGVVHRDLKPSNIMVGSFSEVQVMDWGLACEVSHRPEPTPLDAENLSVMGTPAYMAPEQAQGISPPDVRLDVFALGAILCEILTGAPPFAEGDGGTFVRASKGELQPALDRLHSEWIDPDLVALACRCLSVDPAERPADAGLIALALNDHQASVQERLRQAELQRAAAEARVAAERRSRRLLVSMVVIILVGTIGGWIGWEKSRQARSAGLTAQAAHQADLSHRIEAALSEARLLRTEARSQGADLIRWEATLARARAAIGRAAALANEGSTETEDSLNQARLALEADDRDRRLVRTFDRIRMTRTDARPVLFDAASAARRYEQAFAEAKIELFGLPIGAVAARISERPIREHLAEAIEEWATLLAVADDRRNQLLDIADRLAPNPWRDRLRDALRVDDPARFIRLAEEAPATLPPACQLLLADALSTHGEASRAIALLRRVREHHPADFRVNHRLAYRLHRVGPASLLESLRYYTAAQALRQDSPGLYLEIGVIHATLGQIREAEQAARRAMALDPNLGWALEYVRSRGESR